MDDPQPNVCVLASSFFLTVTIEPLSDSRGDELHFHPDGQGFWVARMLKHLGARPAVVAPVGGESGSVLCGLAPAWNVHLEPVAIRADSPAYIHDRRTGKRVQIARSRMPVLNRHETDTLYGRILELAAACGACVVTGKFPGDSLPLSFYRRLGADLHSVGALVVGDLHAAELTAFLEGGPLHTLKISDEDLIEDGALEPDADTERRAHAACAFLDRGVSRVVLSSADHPTLYASRDTTLHATQVKLEAVEHRGSGDAMTAALAASALAEADPVDTIQLACAAGAANVTRHGFANADPNLVRRLAERVKVREL